MLSERVCPNGKLISGLIPQPRANPASAWKWAMMTMACTSSAIDQLSSPLSRSLKEERRRGSVCVCVCVCVCLRGKEGVNKWYYSARLLEEGKVWVVSLGTILNLAT